jgi:hypothetical protein
MHWRTDFRHGLQNNYREYLAKASRRLLPGVALLLIPHHHSWPLPFPRLELDRLGGTDLASIPAAAMRVLLEGKLFLPEFAPEKQSRSAPDNQQR